MIDSRKVAVEIPDGAAFVLRIIALERIVFEIALAQVIFSL